MSMNKRQVKRSIPLFFLSVLCWWASTAQAQPTQGPGEGLHLATVQASQQEAAQATSWRAFASAWRLLEGVAWLAPEDARGILLQVAQELEARPEEGRLLAAALLRHRAAQRLQDLGEAGPAQEQLDGLGLLTTWQIAGPFENGNNAGFDVAQGPESLPFDPQASFQGKVGPVSWRPSRLAQRGYNSLGASVNPDRAVVVYAASQLEVPRKQSAVLRVGVDGAYKIWLNGELVARQESAPGTDLDRDAYLLPLKKGANTLMIKLAGDSSGRLGFYARWTDQRGQPLRLQASEIKAGAVLARPPSGPLRAPAWPSPAEAARQKAQGLGAEAPGRAWSLLDAATIARELRPQDPATPWRDLADQAVAAAPGDARLLARAADFQPQHWRRLELLRQAAALQPRDAWIAWQLVEELRLNQGSSHLPEALELAQRAIELSEQGQGGLAAGPRVLKAKLLMQQELHGQALLLLEPLAQAQPRNVRVLRALRDLYGKLGRQRDVFLLSQRLAELRQSDTSYQLEVAREWMRQSQPAKALPVLERLLALNPGAFQALLLKSRVLYQLERLQEAEAVLDLALELSPGMVGALTRKARLAQRQGDPERAAQLYEQALQVHPDDRSLAEHIQALRPEVASYEAPYRFGQEVMEPDPDAAQLHKGQDFYYLGRQEVVHVAPSGRASRFLQQVVHVLTDEGAKTWSTSRMYYSPGFERVELVSIRVRKADGTLSEAYRRTDYDAGRGSGNLYYLRRFAYVQVPVLEPGDVVEYAWREIEEPGENFREGYFGDLWHLDSSVDVERARYVLLAPAEMPIYVRQPEVKGLKAEVREVSWQDKPHKAHVFEARGLPRVLEDRQMPGSAEVFSYLLVSTYQTWDQVGAWWWNLIKDQLVVDAEVERVVKEVTEGLTDNRQKVQAIHNWVIKNTRYVGIEFGVHGWKPYRTTLCLRRRFGDCKDKASLIKVMLNAAGVDARLVLIRTRRLGDVSESPPNLAIFNHAIAYVPELDLFLDGTAEFNGTQELPFSDQGQLALIVADGGSVEVRRTPVDKPEKNQLTRSLRVDLSQSPNTAEGSFEAVGSDAVWLRRNLDSVEERDKAIENILTSLYLNVDLKEVKVVEAVDVEKPVKVNFKFEGGGFTRQSGGASLLYPAGRSVTLLDRYAPQASRQQDLILYVPYVLRQQVTYTLEEGSAVESLPKPTRGESRFGSYRLAVRHEGRTVTCEVEYSFKTERISVQDYADFRAWLVQVESGLNQPLRLKKKEAAQ